MSSARAKICGGGGKIFVDHKKDFGGKKRLERKKLPDVLENTKQRIEKEKKEYFSNNDCTYDLATQKLTKYKRRSDQLLQEIKDNDTTERSRLNIEKEISLLKKKMPQNTNANAKITPVADLEKK
jgi:hypothetical protein